MKLETITPVLMTFNEEPNLGRSLTRLAWAQQIVILDSLSTDRTREIAESFPNVSWHERPYDTPSQQCNAAVALAETEWVLSLDADYLLPENFPEVLKDLPAQDLETHHAFEVPLRYCVYGKPLRASLLPPRAVLFKKAKAAYFQDGHTHRLKVDGSTGRLPTYIDHDDQKPLLRWMNDQVVYARKEMEKLVETPQKGLPLPDKIRKTGWLAPLLVAPYCLFAKGMILEGKPGLFYTLQRTLAELLLTIWLQKHFLDQLTRRD